MTVSKEVEANIRRLYFAEHWKIGTIAGQLGIHKDIVKRVVGLDKRQPARKSGATVVQPIAKFIDDTLRDYPTLRATRLYDMVRSRGYEGSVRTLREHVRKVRPSRPQRAYFKVESLIGEQAQVDWGHAGHVYVSGARRSLWLFVIVLSWSRAMWGEFVYELTADSLHRSLVRAMAYFGGSPRQWLFDNAKAVVIERHGNGIRFHPQLIDLASHYFAQLQACAPRTPQHKGKVERAIRYVRDRFLAGRVLSNIDQANDDFVTFIEETTNQRPHPASKEKTVGECLDEERQRLIALPSVQPVTDLITPAVVSKDAFVRFDSNRYLVPPDLVEKTVDLVVDDRKLRVVEGEHERAVFERCWGKRQEIKLPKYLKMLEDDRRSRAPSIGQDRLRTTAPQVTVLFERWVEEGRNVGSLTAATVTLLDLYGDEVFSEAVAQVVARGTHDTGALAIVCEQIRHARKNVVPMTVHLSSNVPDRDVIPHSLEDYDD